MDCRASGLRRGLHSQPDLYRGVHQLPAHHRRKWRCDRDDGRDWRYRKERLGGGHDRDDHEYGHAVCYRQRNREFAGYYSGTAEATLSKTVVDTVGGEVTADGPQPDRNADRRRQLGRRVPSDTRPGWDRFVALLLQRADLPAQPDGRKRRWHRHLHGFRRGGHVEFSRVQRGTGLVDIVDRRMGVESRVGGERPTGGDPPTPRRRAAAPTTTWPHNRRRWFRCKSARCSPVFRAQSG